MSGTPDLPCHHPRRGAATDISEHKIIIPDLPFALIQHVGYFEQETTSPETEERKVTSCRCGLNAAVSVV